MFYRYECPTGFDHPHYGIFMAINDVCDRDKALELTAIFEDNLLAPPMWYYDEKGNNIDKVYCCFTSKGNRKFSKAIREMKKTLEDNGHKVARVTIDEKDAEILYQDEYQVVIDARPILESSTTSHNDVGSSESKWRAPDQIKAEGEDIVSSAW